MRAVALCLVLALSLLCCVQAQWCLNENGETVDWYVRRNTANHRADLPPTAPHAAPLTQAEPKHSPRASKTHDE